MTVILWVWENGFVIQARFGLSFLEVKGTSHGVNNVVNSVSKLNAILQINICVTNRVYTTSALRYDAPLPAHI